MIIKIGYDVLDAQVKRCAICKKARRLERIEEKKKTEKQYKGPVDPGPLTD